VTYDFHRPPDRLELNPLTSVPWLVQALAPAIFLEASAENTARIENGGLQSSHLKRHGWGPLSMALY
jgi:hypothetical protein